MLKKIFIIAISLLLFTSCFNKSRRYYNKGRIEFQQDNFDFAAENIKHALELGGKIPKTEANYYVAESYRLSNRWDQAEKYYEEAVNLGSHEENALFYYGFALKANGKYAQAEQQFKKYVESGTNFDYLTRAKKELKNIEIIKKVAMQKQKFKVENCRGLNSEFIDYSPIPYKDKFYFTSSRGEGPMFAGQGTRFTDIFEFKFDGFEKFSGVAKPLTDVINQAKTHEATCTFSPDGNTMIFSRSNTGKKKDPTQEVDLFQTHLVNGTWSKPERLPFCGTYSWDSNPYWSADGKRLYFSSNREGGYGAHDIWMARIDEYGAWSDPENLGPAINTAGAEQFPFETADGTLYFASDGHPSFGGLDVFKAQKHDDGHLSIKNLGKPINSNADDFAVYFTTDTSGYFTSNRENGVGDDDIYAFNYFFHPKYLLEATVYGKRLSDHEEVEELLPNARVALMDTAGNILDMGIADSNAVVQFQVETEKVYILKGDKEGYITRQNEFSTVGKTLPKYKFDQLESNVVFKQKVVLDKSSKNGLIEFPPIYYKYNKWDITQASEEILHDMVKVLNDNPDILVELGSHTDPRGTPAYNDELSQLRAESAVSYIIANGIDKSRITAKGYGERQPYRIKKDSLNIKLGTILDDVFLDSIKDDSVSYEVGNQLNRRTEFKIVGYRNNSDKKEIEVVRKGEKEKVIEKNNIKHEKEIIKKYLRKEEEEKP